MSENWTIYTLNLLHKRRNQLIMEREKLEYSNDDFTRYNEINLELITVNQAIEEIEG